MNDKSLKYKTKPPSQDVIAAMRRRAKGDDCKLQFLIWASGTRLDAAMNAQGDFVFRPAVCAWEAWKGAWALLRSK